MKILAVRHGVTPWNAQHRWQGTTDIPLSAEGLEQALQGAIRLKAMGWRGSRVFCSALSRSLITAETICSALKLKRPDVVPEFGERQLGEWEGLSVEDIELGYPGLVAAWQAGTVDGPPRGETDGDVANRFNHACRIIRGLLSQEKEPALIITHAGVLHAVDKARRSIYVDYGPLAGRWFDLAAVGASAPRIVPDGCVDLLADEVSVAANGGSTSEALGDR